MVKILVISPTYNEKENIKSFMDSVLAVSDNIDILIVDDNSPDSTSSIVKTHTDYENKVFLISRPKKLGLGSAYCDGFKWALNHNYDKVVQIDADFSHNPKYIQGLLDASNKYDLVIGSRYINGVNVVNWPMNRLILSYLANLYCTFLLRVNIKDFTGGFKCFNRRVLEKINIEKIKSEGYSFQIEMNLIVYSLGYSIKEIPIIFNDRTLGSSKMSKKVIIEAIYMVPILALKRLFGMVV